MIYIFIILCKLYTYYDKCQHKKINIFIFLCIIKNMIRFKLKELISKREFALGKKITQNEIAEATGINRMTLTKINTQKGYSTSTKTLDKLCAFFDCELSDLVEYVSEEEFKQLNKGK